MSNRDFQNAVAYMMGTRDERTMVLLCPSHAAERMAASVGSGDEITYVETVKQAGPRSRCAVSTCGNYPLLLSAGDLLSPRHLVEFMGRVLKMAERQAQVSQR